MKTNVILEGNCLDRLQELLDNSIDCVITSPPYYSLRAYKTQPQIWDADPKCDHDWDDIKSKLHSGRGDLAQADFCHGKGNIPDTPIEYGFCKKCNAWRGELGLEPSLDLFLDHILQIFDEIKRILKPTGTLWVNLGDTYNGSGGAGGDYNAGGLKEGQPKYKQTRQKLAHKTLLGIPDRFKVRMIDSGWICRNEIIWYKRNCMPSSAKDRFTVDFEKIFFFTKSEKYYFETQYRPYSEATLGELEKAYNGQGRKDYEANGVQNPSSVKSRIVKTGIKFGGNKADGYGNPTYSGKEWNPTMGGGGTSFRGDRGSLKADGTPFSENMKGYEEYRIATRPGNDTGNGKSGTLDDPNAGLHNSELSTKREQIVRVIDGKPFGSLMRCVWDITTKGFPDAHFATFPEDLIETPIKAGCPEWVCKKCGIPRFPIMEPSEEYKKFLGKGFHDHKNDLEQGMMQDSDKPSISADYRKVGLTDCGCNAGFEGGVVLDPFFGSGTTGVVALKLGRRFLGIELNGDYIKMAMRRLEPYLSQKTLV